jgi:hypothetical protein
MPTIDYSKTVIYQLTCPTFEDVYVSYTTNLRVKKSKYSRPDKLDKPLEFQDTINLHGGFKKWDLIILENYPDCKCKEDAIYKVNLWYNTLRPPPESSEIPLANRMCKKCGKIFTRSDNLLRHIKSTCLLYNKRDEICQQLDEEVVKKYKELETINKELDEKLKKLKKLDELYEEKNKQLTIVNEKINKKPPENINLVELGHEKLCDVFTVKYQKFILSKKYKSLEYLISEANFNKKYQQFHNICITNIHNRIAYKYVDSKKCFITITKDVLYRELKMARLNDIIDFTNKCADILDENTKRIMNEFINKMVNDDEYAENYCKDDMKNMIYNGSKINNISNLMKSYEVQET